MKVFDCFPFFNEIEILELRLMELDDTVDHFVLVEANKTHTGKPKDFVFERNKDRFTKWLDKIIYVKVEDLPDYSPDNIWVPENFQRNAIMRGLEGRATKEDVVIVSDVDEIPNTEVIKANLNEPEWVTCVMNFYYYYVNNIVNQLWGGSVIARYGSFETPQNLRYYGLKRRNGRPKGGWHYSYMGDPEKIRYKVENIAESKNVIGRMGDLNEIERKMKTQKDLYSRNGKKQKIIDIDDYKPRMLDEFLKKYPEFFFKA